MSIGKGLKSMFGRLLVGRPEDQEELARQRRRRLRQGADLTGMEISDILDRVEKALAPESEAIMDEVAHHVTELEDLPDTLPDGRPRHPHGFLTWLWGLQAGHSRLPKMIPHSVVRVWRHGKFGCQPLRRCSECLFAFPNYFGMCPSCGCPDMEWAILSKPWGEYTADTCGGPVWASNLEAQLHEGHAD